MSALAVVITLIAGGVASVARYGVSLAFAARKELPWAVLCVNVVGSAIGGVVLGLVDAGTLGPDLRLIVLSGFAGGLTTFSTWSTETIQLVREGRWRTAALSVLLNLVLGTGVATLAYLATR